jgi:hypothetical protein
MSWQRVAILILAFGGVLIAQPPSARASTWGCQVILCMSNPGGPEQYGACVPPIQKLYDVLAHGGSFPTCSEGRTIANLGYEPPYLCPAGSPSAGGLAENTAYPTGCYYTDPKTQVTYLLAAVQNPYTMAVHIAWDGGSETVYIDTATDRSSLTPPQPPPVTTAMLATAIEVSGPTGYPGGGN